MTNFAFPWKAGFDFRPLVRMLGPITLLVMTFHGMFAGLTQLSLGVKGGLSKVCMSHGVNSALSSIKVA